MASIDDGKKSSNTSDDEKAKKVTEEKTENFDLVEYIAPKKSNSESSFQSISKYNFLFYMVYKIKYMDSEGNSTSKSTPAEE